MEIVLKRLWQNLQICLRPSWQTPEVAALYAAMAAQSRQPALYKAGGVPDSLDGRFDLLSLHLALLMRRLQPEGRAGGRLRQAVFDFFAADMDRSLREMGVGDMGISRRVRLMGEAFYGRARAYNAALDAPEPRPALMTALDKNLYGTVPTNPAALGWMADYILRLQDYLDRQPAASILSGTLALPPP